MNLTNQHIDDCLYEIYTGYGVQFRYPGAWALSETRQSDEVTIQVESGETSFWSLTLLFDLPEPADVIEVVSQAFREEYPELDLYASHDQLNGRPTWGCDIEFVSFELVNSAFVRCFQADDFTGVVLYQGTDLELETTQPEMDAMTKSLAVTDDADSEEAHSDRGKLIERGDFAADEPDARE
ncbi:MAG: hypothetical protein WEB58_17945 [Planctomycetaceae bacterium]